jgi:hypothetical protein
MPAPGIGGARRRIIRCLLYRDKLLRNGIRHPQLDPL